MDKKEIDKMQKNHEQGVECFMIRALRARFRENGGVPDERTYIGNRGVLREKTVMADEWAGSDGIDGWDKRLAKAMIPFNEINMVVENARMCSVEHGGFSPTDVDKVMEYTELSAGDFAIDALEEALAISKSITAEIEQKIKQKKEAERKWAEKFGDTTALKEDGREASM